MDYEKKYKEALEIAKRCYKDLNNLDGVVSTMSKDFFEEVFTELKESEDEKNRRIKKERMKINVNYLLKNRKNIPENCMKIVELIKKHTMDNN